MKTPHIFIDTNIFISQSYQYNSTAFKQIISLAQSEKVFVYLTTVTLQEVKAHIEKDVYKAHEAFEGFRNKPDLRILKNVTNSPLHGIFNGFDVEQAKEVLLNQFTQFLQDARVQILEIADVSIDEVFDKYFSRTPPFGEKDKKAEFPDAFALAALEGWCKDSSGRMYVISDDGDMVSACREHQSFKSVQSLSEFLDLLTKGEELAEFVSKLVDAHKWEIEQQIKQAPNPLNLYYEPHGEVQYTHVNSVNILKHYLIEVDERIAVLEVIATVNYSANVLYHNYAIGMMMGMTAGWREEFEHGNTNIKAEVSISFNKDGKNEFNIEHVAIKSTNLFMFPDEGPDDFARKYTKAQKDLPEHLTSIIEGLGGVEWVINNTPEAIMKRFEEIKESLSVRVILDLQTLNRLNTYNSGLNYQGAITIKHQAETIKRTNNNNGSDRNHAAIAP